MLPLVTTPAAAAAHAPAPPGPFRHRCILLSYRVFALPRALLFACRALLLLRALWTLLVVPSREVPPWVLLPREEPPWVPVLGRLSLHLPHNYALLKLNDNTAPRHTAAALLSADTAAATSTLAAKWQVLVGAAHSALTAVVAAAFAGIASPCEPALLDQWQLSTEPDPCLRAWDPRNFTKVLQNLHRSSGVGDYLGHGRRDLQAGQGISSLDRST